MASANCSKCQRYHSWPDALHIKIVCKCGQVIPCTEQFQDRNRPKANAWQVIHSRYAAAIESGRWNHAEELNWFETEFSKLLPCVSCGERWESIKGKIDLSAAEAAFTSCWSLHNAVSTQHVKPAKEAISYDLCRALYLQQPSMDDCCYAVTSLSMGNEARQSECLTTWKRAGLTVFAVQTAAEISVLREKYPQVSTWICHSDIAAPTLNRMADMAVTLQRPVLIINADIEIRGEQRVIREAVGSGGLIGIRHNYATQWWLGSLEQWGLDVFSVSPEDAKGLPRLSLRIGKPVWDYWLLHHFAGSRRSWIAQPMFFHRSHAQNWSAAEWTANAAIFSEHYGLKKFDSVKFRRKFPFSG